MESVCGITLHLPLQLTELGTSQRQILYDGVTRLLGALTRPLVLSTQQKRFQVGWNVHWGNTTDRTSQLVPAACNLGCQSLIWCTFSFLLYS